MPISDQLKAALVVAVDLATKLALSHEAPPEEGDLRAKLDFAVGGDQAICERIGELLVDVDGRPDDSVSPAVENLPFRLARISRILSDRTDRSKLGGARPTT